MDYFTRLAQQALGDQVAEAVRPRLPGRFEPGGVLQHAPAAPELSAEIAAPPDTAFESRPAPMRRDASVDRTIAPAPRQSAKASLGQTPAPQGLASVEHSMPEAAQARTEAAPRHAAVARPLSEAPIARAETTPPVAPALPPIALAARPGNPLPRAITVAPALAPPAPADVRSQIDAAPPVIRVSIGRVEVRAVMRPAAPPRPATAPQPAAAPLEDYLRADKGGRPR